MKALVFIIVLLLNTHLMAQFSPERQLLVFRNKATSLQAAQQLELLGKSAEGVKERDIRISIVEKESMLFQKYKVDPTQYTVILIGKDGLEKYRSNIVIEAVKLFAIIDAMPMRRAEMKKQ